MTNLYSAAIVIVIAALTRARHKKSSHTRDTTTFKCTLRERLVSVSGGRSHHGRAVRKLDLQSGGPEFKSRRDR